MVEGLNGLSIGFCFPCTVLSSNPKMQKNLLSVKYLLSYNRFWVEEQGFPNSQPGGKRKHSMEILSEMT